MEMLLITDLINVILSPRDNIFTFHLESITLTLSTKKFHGLIVRGFMPIGIPRNINSFNSILQERKLTAASKKWGLALIPITILLWKLAYNPETKLNPLSIAFIAYKLFQLPSPMIRVSSVN